MDKLILGWKVNNDNHPEYWLKKNNRNKDRKVLEESLISITPTKLKTHSVIFGQSGSAKTSFLARIIEELSLKTKANLVILDANADFSFFKDVKPAKLWNSANYEETSAIGVLPHESRRSDFLQQWKEKVSSDIAIFSSIKNDSQNNENYKIYWPDFPINTVISGLDTFENMQMERIHKYVCFIYEYFEFLELLQKEYDFEEKKQISSPFETSLELLNKSMSSIRFASEEYKRDWIKTSLITEILNRLDFHDDIIEATKCVLNKHKNYEIPKRQNLNHFSNLFFGFLKGIIADENEKGKFISPRELIKRDDSISEVLIDHLNLVLRTRMEYFVRIYKDSYMKFLAEIIDEKIIGLYKYIYYKYNDARVITDIRPTPFVELKRINVMNLISYSNKEIRNILIFDMLRNCWSHATNNWRNAYLNKNRQFKPVFIVLEEAHNVIPSTPTSDIQKKIIELSRTIAAEGRKFNIFFLLVTQRPDKLDKLILSECQNKAFMRLESQKLLDEMRNLILIEDDDFEKIKKNCPNFNMSRVLLTGNWSHEEQIFYTAARRTIKGGVEIDDEHWATL